MNQYCIWDYSIAFPWAAKTTEIYIISAEAPHFSRQRQTRKSDHRYCAVPLKCDVWHDFDDKKQLYEVQRWKMDIDLDNLPKPIPKPQKPTSGAKDKLITENNRAPATTTVSAESWRDKEFKFNIMSPSTESYTNSDG